MYNRPTLHVDDEYAMKVMDDAVRQKKLAALGSVGSAVVLVCLKAFLVIATGSLGILSEMLHSILDLIAAVITYLSCLLYTSRCV